MHILLQLINPQFLRAIGLWAIIKLFTNTSCVPHYNSFTNSSFISINTNSIHLNLLKTHYLLPPTSVFVSKIKRLRLQYKSTNAGKNIVILQLEELHSKTMAPKRKLLLFDIAGSKQNRHKHSSP